MYRMVLYRKGHLQVSISNVKGVFGKKIIFVPPKTGPKVTFFWEKESVKLKFWFLQLPNRMALFPVTLSDPPTRLPQTTQFLTFCIAYVVDGDRDFKFGR